MNSKMKSLSEFAMSQNELESTKGGLFYGSGAYWTRSEPYDISYGTGSIGTYVNGFNMGTDGHED